MKHLQDHLVISVSIIYVSYSFVLTQKSIEAKQRFSETVEDKLVILARCISASYSTKSNVR